KLLQTEDYDLPSAMEFLINRERFFKDLRLETALNEMLLRRSENSLTKLTYRLIFEAHPATS
ncbi:hypothetical protein TNCV_761431, partial [Trichonephila clavipes]